MISKNVELRRIASHTGAIRFGGGATIKYEIVLRSEKIYVLHHLTTCKHESRGIEVTTFNGLGTLV